LLRRACKQLIMFGLEESVILMLILPLHLRKLYTNILYPEGDVSWIFGGAMKKLIFTVIVLSFHLHVFSQTHNVQFPLRIEDTNGGDDTLIFGNDQNATYGVDMALGEYSSPPDPPGFFAKFISIPGRVNTWGTGIIPKDLRPLPLAYSPLHEDTFYVYFSNDNPDAYNATATMYWPVTQYLRDRCDSMFILDPTRAVLPNRINMFGQDSVVLPDIYDQNGSNPAAPAFKFFIFVYGINPLALAVKQATPQVPATFYLYQNYPDPFNPTTTIQFDLPKSSYVSLKIFNILGEEIATLVNERREPGRYSADFDASRYPSGLYFYRIVAKDFTQTKKMLLIK
jgi:hypothetical protein